MDIKKALFELCRAAGPSGAENDAVLKAAELLKPYMDKVGVDMLGNVIGERLCGKKGAKKIALDAHLDEIGLIVTGHEDGYLRFAAVGGVDMRMLVAKEVRVLAAEPLYGIVSCLPPHLQTAEAMNRAFEPDKLFIDIGMSEERARECAPVGTRVIYDGECAELGSFVCGKAMDDRACFVMLLLACELLSKRELDVDLYILGSVQEETGGRGAKTGVFSIAPDICVCADVTHAGTPDAPKGRTFEAGGGPAIGVGPNTDRALTDKLLGLAEKNGIKYQLEVMEGNSGTNAWPIQVSREGIRTTILSLPLKYMHSPSETLHMSDLEVGAKLLADFVLLLSEEGTPLA